MKLSLTIFLFFLFTCICLGQTFEVETIVNNGDNDSRINIVILGDGYRASELSKFEVDAEKFSNYLFTQAPFKEYRNYFNVHVIKVPSNESGANHPGTATDVSEPSHPVRTVDNYFGSSFDTAGIHRLLTINDFSRMNSVLFNNFPNYDQVFVLVNSPYYGGAGGTFAVASSGAGSDEVAVHEMGHSFSNLADEYWAGDVYARELANLTQEDNPALIKWKNWLGFNGVGIFEHNGSAIAPQWNRPHQNCKMRLLGNPFCPVCTEAIVETVHDLTNPIIDFTPNNIEVINNPTFPLELKVNAILPIPNSLEFVWSLNGSTLTHTADNLILESTDLMAQNTLSVTIEDTSNFLQIDNHEEQHKYSITWQINYAPDTDNDDDNDGVTNDNDLCPNTVSNATVNENGCATNQLDDDNDGVNNDRDTCPNTAEGITVDATGCANFTLPNDNFTIAITSESCASSNNGSVTISASQNLNYRAVLNFPNQEQQELTFDQNTNFENLPAGRYGLCLYVEEENTFEQCYEIEIGEPEPLGVSSKVNAMENKIALTLSGADTYFIDLNGKTYQTDQSSITLPLNEVENLLSVRTEKECQGTYSKSILLKSEILVSPNPVDQGDLNIVLDSDISEILAITIMDLNGKIVLNTSVRPSNGNIKVNVSSLSAGMYLLNIKTATSLTQFKILKK